MSWSTIIVAGFLVMLAVLGHSVWHHEVVAVANIIVTFFTGAHVVG